MLEPSTKTVALKQQQIDAAQFMRIKALARRIMEMQVMLESLFIKHIKVNYGQL